MNIPRMNNPKQQVLSVVIIPESLVGSVISGLDGPIICVWETRRPLNQSIPILWAAYLYGKSQVTCMFCQFSLYISYPLKISTMYYKYHFCEVILFSVTSI